MSEGKLQSRLQLARTLAQLARRGKVGIPPRVRPGAVTRDTMHEPLAHGAQAHLAHEVIRRLQVAGEGQG